MTTTLRARARRASSRTTRVTLAVAIACLLTPAPAFAASEAPSPSATPTPVRDNVVTVRLNSDANLSTRPGSEARIQIVIDNDHADAVPAASLIAEITPEAFPTFDDAVTWLSGSDEPAVQATESVDIDGVAAGDEATVTLPIPVADDRAPGVYAVRATIEGVSNVIELRTLITVADPYTATPASVIVPVTAPPAPSGLLSASQVASLTSANGALTELLDGVGGSTVALAIDPAIPAAIRALGASAPATATQWLERLDNLPNERFALQFGDADVAAQLAAGRTDLLTPESLIAYQSPAPPSTPGTTPPSTATPAPAEVTPTPTAAHELDDLLDIGDEVARIVWPLPGTMSPEGTNTLAERDIRTLTSTRDIDTQSDRTAVHANAGLTLVSDHELAALLGTLADSQTPSDDERSAALATTAAKLWFAARDLGSDHLLIALDRAPDDRRTAATLRDAVQTLSRNDGVSLTPLSDLLTSAPKTIPLSPPRIAASPARLDILEAAATSDADIRRTATVLRDPNLLIGQVRAETLQMLSVGWSSRTAEWAAAREAFHASLTQRSRAISVQVNNALTLAGSDAPIPVWVSNALPWPIEATIHAEPDDVRLNIDRRVNISVPPGSNPRIQIPVTSRLGNGEVNLSVAVFNRAGEQVTDEQTSRLTVRADWEVIGVWVITATLAVLIVGGVTRTVIARRRRRNETRMDTRG